MTVTMLVGGFLGACLIGLATLANAEGRGKVRFNGYVNGLGDPIVATPRLADREQMLEKIRAEVPMLLEGDRNAVVDRMFEALESRSAEPAGRRIRGGVRADDITTFGVGVSCTIVDDMGTDVEMISATDVGDAAYFFRYDSGGQVSNRVIFVAIPASASSPLQAVVQQFGLSPASDTGILTPFGIPFWGGDLTSGPWALIVFNDVGGSNFCLFDVVP